MTDQNGAPDAAVATFGDAMHDVLMALPESERFKKAKHHLLDDLWDELQYSLIDRMSEAIEGFVRDMATRTVDAIIKGNESEVRRYLKLDGWTGRHEDTPAWGGRQDIASAHPIIHGRLHENQAIRLRREIAQAHADLIRNERIADLEDIVASLEVQVAKADAEMARMANRRDEV